MGPVLETAAPSSWVQTIRPLPGVHSLDCENSQQGLKRFLNILEVNTEEKKFGLEMHVRKDK